MLGLTQHAHGDEDGDLMDGIHHILGREISVSALRQAARASPWWSQTSGGGKMFPIPNQPLGSLGIGYMVVGTLVCSLGLAP